MKVNRENLRRALKLVSRGLSSRGIVEQSDAFVFRHNRIIAYNGEVMVRVKNPCGIEGVVPSVELMNMVERFSGEEIEITQEHVSKELRLKCGRASAGLSFEVDVRAAISEVPQPKEWLPASPELLSDLIAASKVCGHDETMAVTMCVRVLPDRIQACDNFRAVEIERPTGVPSEFYIGAGNVDCLRGLQATKFAVTDGWWHFRVAGGVVSIRGRVFDSYPDIGPLMRADGEVIAFPKELREGIQRAQVTTEQQPSAGGRQMRFITQIQVVISKGEAKISSSSGSGWYEEVLPLEYSGPSLSFVAHPDSLLQMLDHSFKIKVGSGKLIAHSDPVTFVIATTSPNAHE